MVTALVGDPAAGLVVLTERVRKRKEAYLATKPKVCPDRANLITESYKETDGQPVVIRRAKAFEKLMERLPIVIREGELLVGSQTPHIRGVCPDPEIEDTAKIRKELMAEKLVVFGDHVEGLMSEEDRQVLLAACDYWDGKSAGSISRTVYRELFGSRVPDFDEAIIWTGAHMSLGSRTGNFGKVIEHGLNSIIQEAQNEMNKSHAYSSPDAAHKYHVLQSMIISLEAMKTFARRHSDLARQMAEQEHDPVRKDELLRIAEVCARVPAEPARTFQEALQSFWFVFLGLNLESGAQGEAPGRFDQYTYPSYKREMDNGTLTREAAAELIGCLWIKFLEMTCFSTGMTKVLAQASHFINVTIGGQKEDGTDGTNDISFLVLEACRQIKPHQPHVSLRYHDKINWQFMVKAIEANRDHGGGVPAFFNDKAAVLGLTQWGIPLAEARNWVPQGCVERTIYPSSGLYSNGPHFNMPKMLELALNDGVDPRTGKQLGAKTGNAREFNSFDQVLDAFKAQLAYFIPRMAEVNNTWKVLCSQHTAFPFNSALLDGCIESGKDTLEAGGKWNKFFLTSLRPFGHANVANSLAAMRKVVFEDRFVSLPELLDALTANFEGKNELRRRLLAAPKWGNDDDYVDDIMRELFKVTEDLVHAQINPWGEHYGVSRQGLTLHYLFGPVVGALPDGRKAKAHLADASLSAMRGTDLKGPTAIYQSAAKLDAVGSESTLLNIKFHPSTFKNREGVDKLLALVKTYFDCSGYHTQFNILGAQTLLEAKKHPEQYRDLVVRVAGFSAYFVELAPEIQDEIIARTEHSLC